MLRIVALLMLSLPATLGAGPIVAQGSTKAAAGGPAASADAATGKAFPKALAAAEVASVLPGHVFFEGQSAPLQTRNSVGIEWAKGRYFLVSLVDTSGYSSAVQERYQAYLLTQEPVLIGGHALVPGAYGCGFLASQEFVVMDLGGHTLFTASTQKDAGLKRPTPLQMHAARESFYLFAGRTWVEIKHGAATSGPGAAASKSGTTP